MTLEHQLSEILGTTTRATHYEIMRSCVGGACAMMSEPLSMNGSTLVCILQGGPILHNPGLAQNHAKDTRTYPYLAMDLNSSTFRFKCSHLVTTIPAPGVAAPPRTFDPFTLPDGLNIPTPGLGQSRPFPFPFAHFPPSPDTPITLDEMLLLMFGRLDGPEKISWMCRGMFIGRSLRDGCWTLELEL